uniref:Transmembrane protein n=1 Tax=Caenorhabditis tropicalis TaxID=1561998 RepID=A0A1I7UCJ7_9PELO
MRIIKEYPENAAEIRQLVENRRHYLNVIYAAAILGVSPVEQTCIISDFQTFQLCTSYGWYSYLAEAYTHLTSGFETIIHISELIFTSLALLLLYFSLYNKRSAILVLLVIFYFLYSCSKLLQIAYMYPFPRGFRHKFSSLTRYSEYDAMSLTYDSVMCASSLISCVLCFAATWHFTPLVIVKMNYKETQQEAVAQAMRKLKRTKLTTCDVNSSDEETAHRITRGPDGKQFVSKNYHKKTFSTQITDKADVTLTTSGARSTRVR